MKQSLGLSYLAQVEHSVSEMHLGYNDAAVVAVAGSVALERLRTILLITNGAIFILTPVIAWGLTKRSLAPLQRIHDRQKQFVSDVAHELRTPLTIMNGELEVALRRDRTSHEYEAVLVSSKEETERLINLVENLLFLAKGDQGKFVIEFEKVELTDLIRSVIANLQTDCTQKNITLHFETCGDHAFVSGQPSMLRRLFFNIIHNAIQYTPVEGNIWVSLSVNKQHREIRVKDTGIGISAEDQKKIFDRFYRVESSRSQTRGYGLGLAICKSIIKIHDGTIAVNSTLGLGSTFVVTLPPPGN